MPTETSAIGFEGRHYAMVNMTCAILWIAVVSVIAHERKKLSPTT
jgi:hypothetical protein